MKRLFRITFVSIFGLSSLLFAQAPKQQTTPPDNTKVNARDRNGSAPTADQQKGNPSDVDITARIRKLLTADKSLSTNAKNVKVITENGNVTLRGPVASTSEKKSVEAKAAEIAGATHVKSELEIAAKQTQSKK